MTDKGQRCICNVCGIPGTSTVSVGSPKMSYISKATLSAYEENSSGVLLTTFHDLLRWIPPDQTYSKSPDL